MLAVQDVQVFLRVGSLAALA
jgi:hypothetical protein